MRGSWIKRYSGIALFLGVTAIWVSWLAAWELGWNGPSESGFVAALVLSAVSLVMTGYLGRFRDALLLGWIPGATTFVLGVAMTPTPGADNTGGGLIFVGVLLLIPGWPLFFFPLIALGVVLRRVRGREPSPSARERLPASEPEEESSGRSN
jgi:hypothetical protein